MALFAEDQKVKNRNLAAMLLILALTFGASQSVLAGKPVPNTDPNVCTPDLALVKNALEIAGMSSNDTSRLSAKVDFANSKLNVDKPLDAVQKLDDIYYKVMDLSAAPKTKIDDGADVYIYSTIDDAKACIAIYF